MAATDAASPYPERPSSESQSSTILPTCLHRNGDGSEKRGTSSVLNSPHVVTLFKILRPEPYSSTLPWLPGIKHLWGLPSKFSISSAWWASLPCTPLLRPLPLCIASYCWPLSEWSIQDGFVTGCTDAHLAQTRSLS